MVAACTSNSDDGGEPIMAGAASRSVLPTVNGERAYLDDAPGWPSRDEVDPNDPGIFIESWDQGRVDVGNGRSDSAWVHDDLRTTALALEVGDERAVLVMADTYSYFGIDIAAMLEIVRARVPEDWQEVPILVSATHNQRRMVLDTHRRNRGRRRGGDFKNEAGSAVVCRWGPRLRRGRRS